MWPAFPTSDYYEGSVPSCGQQSTADLPAAALAGQRVGQPRDGSHVHHEPVDELGAQLCPCSIATGTPQSFPMASPPMFGYGFGVDHPKAVVHCNRPTSTRFEPGRALRGFTTGSLSLHLLV